MTVPRHGRRRLPGRPSESGAAAVEFALVFCFVLVPLVTGMLEYGYYYYSSSVSGSATREAARRLSVGDCQAAGKAQAFARQTAGLSGLTLTFGTPTTQSNTLPGAGEVLRVRTTVDAKIFTILPLPADGVITREVDVRVEDSTEDTPC